MPKTERNIYIHGIPDSLSKSEQAVWRSRIDTAARKCLDETGLREINVTISTKEPIDTDTDTKVAQHRRKGNDEATKEERAAQFRSREPSYSFDALVVPEDVRRNLLRAISLVRLKKNVFDDWNLRKIEPFPRTALNFHGDPGTGKTLAGHAIAHYLNRRILVASYAQIESKFHGDGPKNVESIFYAAERDNAVLFIDEADSLLSKRLTDVTQGSEQAINSMRSQLLICLEQFSGVAIFATNLVGNYDRAFETRIRNIHFPMPDEKLRLHIWNTHLKFENGPPLATNVSIEELAQINDLCGRDIKNSVIDAALRAAQDGREKIEMKDIIEAIRDIKAARIDHKTPGKAMASIAGKEEKEETEEQIKKLASQHET